VNFLFFCQGDGGELEDAVRQRLGDEHTLTKWQQNDTTIPLSDIDAAVVWLPPDDFFSGLTNLTHVFALAAGVDHLLKHPGLPPSAQVVRLRDAGMGVQMAEYVLYGVLHAQRRMQDFGLAQDQKRWAHDISAKSATDTRVGILGAGALGSLVADRLVLNGYPVSCWTRTSRSLPGGVYSVQGDAALPDFLSNCDVLVCLLPLTDTTTGFLNRSLFEQLPRGAFLINPGRGAHVIDEDLVEALNSGHISGAMLDVFHHEPLDRENLQIK